MLVTDELKATHPLVSKLGEKTHLDLAAVVIHGFNLVAPATHVAKIKVAGIMLEIAYSPVY